MTLVDDNVFPKLILAEGTAPASPSAGQFKVYFDSSDHLFKFKNSSGTVTTLGQGVADQGTATYFDFTTGAAPSSPASGKVRLYSKTGDHMYQKVSGGTETALDGAGGGSDVVNVASGAGSVTIPGILIPDRVPGSPSANDDEFDTTDTSDPIGSWTTLGTLDTLDTNSSAASHLRLQKTSTGTFSLYGIYKAIPSMPFTVTTRISDMTFSANYHRAMLMLLEAGGSNKIFEFGMLYSATANNFGYGNWTNRTSRASWGGDRGLPAVGMNPVYIRLVVTSSSSVATYMSRGGLVWQAVDTGVNPGFTIANVGLGITGEDNSVAMDAYFDYIRFT